MAPGGPFAPEGPRWFTIPSHRPFVEDLARGLHQTLSPMGSEALSGALVLTPTRRGARALAEAFVAVAGERAVLLPQIRALGDLDEGEPPFEPGDLAVDLPPAIGPYRRRFELAALTARHADRLGRSLDVTAALELGDALGAFLDSVQIEEVRDLDRLDTLVEGDIARHWQVSADFLRLAAEAWPARLQALGLTDVSERRVGLLRALADQWRLRPPPGVLVAAGSTGTAPATADLLAVIAAAPQGAVVLPGLDLDLANPAWEQIKGEAGEQHPQGAMKRLLHRAAISRDDVRLWPGSPPADGGSGRWRRRLVNEALRPPDATADWLDVINELRAERRAPAIGLDLDAAMAAALKVQDPVAEGLDGLSLITGRSEEETATVAALLLREVLETPGKTAALVTPDRDLARRVSAKLSRWGVLADASAGAPLGGFPVGDLLALLAAAATDPTDPVRLLAIVKNPLVRLGLEPEVLEARRQALERFGLRGARRSGWDALQARLREQQGKARDAQRIAELAGAAQLLAALQGALAAATEPFASGHAQPALAVRGAATAAEALAAGPGGDLGGLWAGPAGEAAGGLVAAAAGEAGELPECSATDFAHLMQTLIGGCLVRSGGGAHPRLRVLGAIEARLIRADRMILAGLEEGVWPQAAPADPFLSRPMRAVIGLPPPERRIGLSAHDFAQAACAPEVYLLHSERRGGSPAVKSRWLWRLETLARGAGIKALPSRPQVLAWARALDAPLADPPPALRMAPRPRPAPPLAARPAELPVTGVETWVRDPYAVYARYVLRLRQMERPDEPVESRARGTAVHAAFETFARDHPRDLPEDAEARFNALLLDALETAGMSAPRMARERALAANVAPWVVAFEQRRRQGGVQLLIEEKGSLTLTIDGRPFTLTAKADRIEVRGGEADILDFKTGSPPKLAQVKAGFSPQLTLTAAILARGGFSSAGAVDARQLVYVQITGRKPPGRDEPLNPVDETMIMAEAAMSGLERRIRLFSLPQTAYVSWAAPHLLHQYASDYDHLARVWEWRVVGEAEGAEGT